MIYVMVIFGKIEIFDHVLKWMTYNVYTGSYISIFELISFRVTPMNFLKIK